MEHITQIAEPEAIPHKECHTVPGCRCTLGDNGKIALRGDSGFDSDVVGADHNHFEIRHTTSRGIYEHLLTLLK
jgi:hypothetical protein